MLRFLIGLAAVALAAIAAADTETDGPRAEFEAIASGLEEGHNSYLGSGQLASIRVQLRDSSLTLMQRTRLNADLSSHLLRLGQINAAIAQIAHGPAGLRGSGRVRGSGSRSGSGSSSGSGPVPVAVAVLVVFSIETSTA